MSEKKMDRHCKSNNNELVTHGKYFNSACKWHQEWSMLQYFMSSTVFYHSLPKVDNI